MELKLFFVQLKPENCRKRDMENGKKGIAACQETVSPYRIYIVLDYSTKEVHEPEKVIFFLIWSPIASPGLRALVHFIKSLEHFYWEWMKIQQYIDFFLILPLLKQHNTLFDYVSK